MAKPFSLKSWRWSGGGLLVLVSVGFHGLLLAMPTPKASTPPEAVMTLASSGDSASPEISAAETIDVVRLPSPAAAPSPAPVAPAPPSAPAPPIAPAPSPRRPPDPLPSPVPPTAPPSAPPASTDPAPTPPVEVEPPVAETEPPTPEPDSAPPEPEPIPPGLVHNNKTVELSTDTRDFLTWYIDQDWDSFDLPPLPAPKELARLQVPYVGEVCLPILPAPGRLEVIVGGDGQLHRAPRLLATTGYDDLDAAVLDLAAQRNYTADANPSQPNPTVYWLPMEVLYQGPTCPPD